MASPSKEATVETMIRSETKERDVVTTVNKEAMVETTTSANPSKEATEEMTIPLETKARVVVITVNKAEVSEVEMTTTASLKATMAEVSSKAATAGTAMDQTKEVDMEKRDAVLNINNSKAATEVAKAV